MPDTQPMKSNCDGTCGQKADKKPRKVGTDIEIAQAATIRPITEVAKEWGIKEKYLELYESILEKAL